MKMFIKKLKKYSFLKLFKFQKLNFEIFLKSSELRALIFVL